MWGREKLAVEVYLFYSSDEVKCYLTSIGISRWYKTQKVLMNTFVQVITQMSRMLDFK